MGVDDVAGGKKAKVIGRVLGGGEIEVRGCSLARM
jgi:hypothetical protein